MPSTSIEHTPPRSLFLDRVWPEGFEFPSCDACNQGTSNDDLVFAVFGRIDPFSATEDSDGKMRGLLKALNRQHPGIFQRVIPSSNEARRKNRELGISPAPGMTHNETGVVKVPDELHAAVCRLAGKLAKGIYYRETDNIFPACGCLLLNWFTNAELVRDGKYRAFEMLTSIAGETPKVERSGKHLGDQFEYKWSLSVDQFLFALQARFSRAFGIVVFGSAKEGLLEEAIAALRQATGTRGPFAVLQSPSVPIWSNGEAAI